MDIFALPDAFLRKMMRKVEIKDRLSLRLTCRAFEKLVAETNAGFFYGGMLQPIENHQGTFSIWIADCHIAGVTEERFDQFIHLFNRLFNGISFGLFDFILSHTDNTLTLDFIRNLTHNFTLEKLGLCIESRELLAISSFLLDKFASSKKVMDLCFLPDVDYIEALPQLDELRISAMPQCCIASPSHYDGIATITSSLFFKLLADHHNIYLDNVVMNAREWMTAVQIISADTRIRTVHLGVKRSLVSNWLIDSGISESTEAGEVVGEFTVECAQSTHLLIELVYRKCSIRIEKFEWTGEEFPVLVEMSNADPWS